jgi:hypothetical protein
VDLGRPVKAVRRWPSPRWNEDLSMGTLAYVIRARHDVAPRAADATERGNRCEARNDCALPGVIAPTRGSPSCGGTQWKTLRPHKSPNRQAG